MFRISRLLVGLRWPSRLQGSSIGPLQVGIILAGLCIIATAWAALSYHLANREAVLREQAQRDVRNLSIAVEKHVERLLVGVDQVMRFMVEDFAGDPEGFNFSSWLKRATSLEAVAHQISMYDENGELVAARTPPAPGMPRFNVRDRAYFQAHAARTDLGLYIDRTLKGRITGRYVLQTARRLTRPNGSFAGVIVTSVDPDYLARQFAALDVGQRGSIAIFGHDGFIRARHPQTEDMYEQNVTTLGSGRGVFAHLAERPEGTYEVASAFDGRTRIFGYRTVGSLPLVVTAGKALDEVLAPYVLERSRALLAGLGFMAFTLVIMLILMRILALKHRQAVMLANANRTLGEQEEMARAAEVRAQEANRILRLSAQIAHVGHWRVKLPSNMLSWSEEIFRIYGIDEDNEPTVATAIAAYHPDDRGHVTRCIAEAVHQGRDFDFSARVARPDGSIRDVVCRGLCERDLDGAVSAIFGTFMDVTELRSAERARGDSEALYRLLADNSSDMITRMDLTGRRLFVSPASRELLGYDPEELVGTNPKEMIHPDDAAGLGAVLAELASGRREQVVNVNRLRHRDGHWVWVEASLRVLRDAEGAPSGVIASIRNVTDRKQAELALQQSEYRYRVLAENTSELIMLGHDDGSRSYISPAVKRLLGYTPEELGAMRLRDYVHPDDLADLYATTRRLGAGEDEVVAVYRSRRKEGGWVWVEGVFRRIPGALAGEPSIVATFRDVSERKAYAQHLEEARSTAVLARQEAEQASRAKTDFLASMSHEIRTPLNGIIGFTGLILDRKDLDAGLQRQVQLIRSSGSALLTVVNDVLDFSKIEADQIEIVPQPFAPAALFDNVISMTRGLGEPKGLGFHANLDPALPTALFGDADRLRQVLLNLMNNAIKFTARGTITLNVACTPATDGMSLRVEVHDTGIGIPADKLGRLFQRFSQVDGSVQREYGGTGLGLAISKRLVELMGGSIGVESTPGRGSTFWIEITLPISESWVAEPAEEVVHRATSFGRILLAEDSAINQEIACAILRAAGYAVDVVDDGAAAVHAVMGGDYALVLMDVQMPIMDGVTATRRIRELHGPHRDVPIVAMTANVLTDQVASFLQAGMNGHIGKPFKRPELFTTIEHWLGTRPFRKAG